MSPHCHIDVNEQFVTTLYSKEKKVKETSSFEHALEDIKKANCTFTVPHIEFIAKHMLNEKSSEKKIDHFYDVLVHKISYKHHEIEDVLRKIQK